MTTSVFNTPVMQNSLRAQQQDSPNSGSEPQRCCVVCERTSPKTIFSCRYKVHERNVDILQKFFERNDLRFGELCDRCYRLWYKHKRTKTTPANKDSSQKSEKIYQQASSTTLQQEQQHGSVINSHESFHGAAASSSSDDDDEDGEDENDQEMLVQGQEQQQAWSSSSSPSRSINQRLQQSRIVSNIFQKQQASPVVASRIEKYQKADFSHCLRALTLLAKPARKSRRKNTPVRSAPRADLYYESCFGYGSSSATLARVVLMKDALLLESSIPAPLSSLNSGIATTTTTNNGGEGMIIEEQQHQQQQSSGEEEEEDEMEKEEPAIENNFAQVLQSASVAV